MINFKEGIPPPHFVCLSFFFLFGKGDISASANAHSQVIQVFSSYADYSQTVYLYVIISVLGMWST
jgi:hypothetical protein